MNRTSARTNRALIVQTIYHTNINNSLHRAYSLEVTGGQGVAAKAKDTIFCFRADLKIENRPWSLHFWPQLLKQSTNIFSLLS